MERIVAGLIKEREGRRVPSIVFTKGGGNWLDAMAGCGADAVGLDWTVDIGEARQRVGGQVALQGNLDPCALHGTPDSIRAEAHRIIDAYGNHPGHVFNLGHGISQYTDPEKVGVLVDAVHRRSRAVRTAGGH
jgi:uroporphyrinogen decarboxylase